MENLPNPSDLSIKELSTGLRRAESHVSCLFCGATFDSGRIYQVRDQLLTAGRAATEHMQSVHDGVLQTIAQLPREYTGLSEGQKDLVAALADRKSDREIARETHRAESTIRSQRFQLRKKIEEAKVLCAIGILLDQLQDHDAEFVSYHSDIPSADDRIITTYAEEREITKRYFEQLEPLKLERFPKKQKEKLVVLKLIAGKFTPGRDYTEREVNELLLTIYYDYVTIRRYLIEYRFLQREKGGTRYWLHATNG